MNRLSKEHKSSLNFIIDLLLFHYTKLESLLIFIDQSSKIIVFKIDIIVFTGFYQQVWRFVVFIQVVLNYFVLNSVKKDNVGENRIILDEICDVLLV